ncbi:MAG: hypothetical protein GY787_00810 [Alteromonadales bacterium]|nr:hypothetical protein [Alteromonadales bacterium]
MFSTIIKKSQQVLLLLISLIFATSLLACSQADKKSSATEVTNTEQVIKVEQSITQKEEVPSRKQLKLEGNKNIPTHRKRTLTINGEKFAVNSAVLTKNSVVFNLNMKEKGRVKGSFVVITQPDKALNIKGLNLKYSNKIAKDTFRLVPVQGENLLVIYQQLLADKSLTRVELEIDYSPANKKMSY